MKKLILAAFMAFSVSLFSPLIAQSAYAACPTGDKASTAKDQVLVGTDTAGSDCSGNDVLDFIRAIVDIVSIVVGVAAVIMIIVSGFKYITSSGDANRIGSAKNTLVYALIGVAIAALAQFLVHFVLPPPLTPPLYRVLAVSIVPRMVQDA